MMLRKGTLTIGILIGGIFSIYGVWVFGTYITVMEEARGLPCDQLPTFQVAKETFYSHNDTRDQMQALGDNSTSITLAGDRCPGKGEIVIFYGGIEVRDRIRNLIGNDFFGVPCRWINI